MALQGRILPNGVVIASSGRWVVTPDVMLLEPADVRTAVSAAQGRVAFEMPVPSALLTLATLPPDVIRTLSVFAPVTEAVCADLVAEITRLRVPRVTIGNVVSCAPAWHALCLNWPPHVELDMWDAWSANYTALLIFFEHMVSHADFVPSAATARVAVPKRRTAMCPRALLVCNLGDLHRDIRNGKIELVKTRCMVDFNKTASEITVPRARGASIEDIAQSAARRMFFWTSVVSVWARGEKLEILRTLEEYAIDDDTPLDVRCEPIPHGDLF